MTRGIGLMMQRGQSGRTKGLEMRTLAMVTLALILSGCASGQVAETVVLDALAKPMTDLAGAVVDDGGPRSKHAARKVIAIYDAGVLTSGESGAIDRL